MGLIAIYRLTHTKDEKVIGKGKGLLDQKEYQQKNTQIEAQRGKIQKKRIKDIQDMVKTCTYMCIWSGRKRRV